MVKFSGMDVTATLLRIAVCDVVVTPVVTAVSTTGEVDDVIDFCAVGETRMELVTVLGTDIIDDEVCV